MFLHIGTSRCVYLGISVNRGVTIIPSEKPASTEFYRTAQIYVKGAFVFIRQIKLARGKGDCQGGRKKREKGKSKKGSSVLVFWCSSVMVIWRKGSKKEKVTAFRYPLHCFIRQFGC